MDFLSMVLAFLKILNRSMTPLYAASKDYKNAHFQHFSTFIKSAGETAQP